MVHKHEKGSGSVAKRLLGLCLALVMLCGVFVPTFASVAGGEDQTQPQQEQTAEPTGSTDGKQDTDGQQTGNAEDANTVSDSEKKDDTGNVSGNTGDADAAKDGEGEANSDANTNGEGTGEANTPANDLPKAETSVVNEVAPQAITGANTVEVGKTINLTSNRGNSNHSWSSSDTSVATVSGNNKNATVKGVSAGVTTITHSWGRGSWGGSETFVVVVPGDIKVYVYVAGHDEAGNQYSDEMLGLLGIDPNTLDTNNYFPVGEITIDASYFVGKSNSDTSGEPLINSDGVGGDWEKLLAALGTLDPSKLIDEDKNYSANKTNVVGTYLEQVSRDVGEGMGSQKSALFRWNGTHSYGFADQSVKYHLDLCFNTNKIIFKYGHNGLDAPTADDTIFDSRVYIKGSTIQPPDNLKIPDGYQFIGYYSDYECKERWDGIGTPLNSDQTVYVKIAELSHTIIKYEVATPNTGTVDPDSEHFNPISGSPNGSTATRATDYVFDGWYTDAKCTTKVSDSENFVPTAPAGGWKSGETYTYYAKFVPATTTVTVKKLVTGLLGDKSKNFSFELSYATSDGVTVKPFTLCDGQEQKFTVPVGVLVTIKETNADGYTTKYQINTQPEVTFDADAERTVRVTVTGETTITFTNHKDANPDTGIFLDSMPYIMALVIVAGGAAAFFLRRRKNSEE